jgi:hypothetical protein
MRDLVVTENISVDGEGRRLLDGKPADLGLVDSTPFRSGVVLLRYRPSASG